jgi:Domain of unknown function (DUF4160)
MRFRIFIRNQHEPPHVHVWTPDGDVVVNLIESTRTVEIRGVDRTVRELDAARVAVIAAEHFDNLMEVWSKYHR